MPLFLNWSKYVCTVIILSNMKFFWYYMKTAYNIPLYITLIVVSWFDSHSAYIVYIGIGCRQISISKEHTDFET